MSPTPEGLHVESLLRRYGDLTPERLQALASAESREAAGITRGISNSLGRGTIRRKGEAVSLT